MKDFNSFLEVNPMTVQQYVQDYDNKKDSEVQSITKELTKLGYSKNNKDMYDKILDNGNKIIAYMNGTGVILHLADDNGNLLTSVNPPVVYPTIAITNPNDLPQAEQDLIGQFPK